MTKPASSSRPATTATTAIPAEERFDPKWSRHRRVLLHLRERLLRERGQQLEVAAQPIEPHSLDLADSASDEFDHDLALGKLSAEQDALYEVEAALQRIAHGGYGICEETGHPISAARLRAIPWTRFAKDVQTRLEKTGSLPHPTLGRLSSTRPLTGDIEQSEPVCDDEQPLPAPSDETLARTRIPAGKHWHPRHPPSKPRASPNPGKRPA